MAALHISISAEKIAQVGPLPISNSIFTSLIVSAFIILFAFLVNGSLTTKGKPGRLQAFAELIVEGLFNLCKDITGSAKKAATFAPIVTSFFLFIILNNWAGLLPGVGTIGFISQEEHAQLPSSTLLAATDPHIVQEPLHDDEEVAPEEAGVSNVGEAHDEETEAAHEEEGTFVPYFRAGTADLNTTIALALISVVLTQYYGIKFLGIPYFSKYINFSSPILFFVGLLETILEFAKIMSFAFRLFGNIFAGEVLLAVMLFLVPLVVPMPFYGLELFVGFIQALVFSMLSLVFFNLATIGHGDEH